VGRWSHWTARYAVDRVRLAAHERLHAGEPWLTGQAVQLLEQLLRPEDRTFEWGSGRSTSWFASRTASVHSVEHEAAWHARVQGEVAGFPHVTVELVASTVKAYVEPLMVVGDVDIVLVDGLHRDACALMAIQHLTVGGLLVVDNVERYLPSSSRSPEAIGSTFATDEWREFADQTAPWRRVWTSNGVTDTAIFVRA
jgi:hypothetical protein